MLGICELIASSSVVDERAIKLSKDEARKVLENLLAEGVNPDDLRAIPD